MVRVAVTFILLAVCLGLIFAEYTDSEPFPLLAYVVWGLTFTVIFAIIYVMWLIYYAIHSYQTHEQVQRMKAFQCELDGKPAKE